MLDNLFKKISFWFINIKNDVKVKDPNKPLFLESREINEEDKIVSEFPTFKEKNNPSLIKLHSDGDLVDILKQTTKVEVKKYKSILTITFKNGEKLSWFNISENKHFFPWAEIYKWYFSKNTPYFCFNSKQDETIFNRKDILFIKRNKTTEEIDLVNY